MRPHKRTALSSVIALVCLGCLSAVGWLVLEHPLTHQPLTTALHSVLGAKTPARTAPALLGHDSRPSAGSRRRLVEGYGRIPLTFEANAGQTDARVKFLSRGPGYTLFLSGEEAVLALRKGEGRNRKAEARTSKRESRNSKFGIGNWKLEIRNSKLETRKRHWHSKASYAPSRGPHSRLRVLNAQP